MSDDDKALLQDLIAQLKSEDLTIVSKALDNLREKRWLFNGVLSQVNLSGANLTGADLRHADLNKSNLIGANLFEADLRGAIMFETDLRGSFLRRANLRGTNLSDANLSGAILHESELTDAILFRANLSGASLSGTNLSRARCVQTLFVEVDLSDATGLETIMHFGPSDVGIRTLYLSHGNIPEAFLRGCGIPDTMIAFAMSFVTKPIDFYSVFISYSHADKAFARRLHDTLQGRGIRCFIDEHAILPGDSLLDAVDRGIKLWDKVLLCCSKASLTSWWVNHEVNLAFQKEAKLTKERGHKVYSLIPLNLDSYLLSDAYQSGLKGEIVARQAPDFTGWKRSNAKFERGMEHVIQALRTERPEAPPSKL